MNWFKRFFKEEIKGKELDNLLFYLGVDKNVITGLHSYKIKDYETDVYGKIDVKNEDGIISFDVDVIQEFNYSAGRLSYEDPGFIAPTHTSLACSIKKSFPYQGMHPFLKKYIKHKKPAEIPV